MLENVYKVDFNRQLALQLRGFRFAWIIYCVSFIIRLLLSFVVGNTMVFSAIENQVFFLN